MTYNEKYALIRNAVLKSDSADPVEIAKSVMKSDFVSIHGPEHHFLDGAAFIVAYKNAGGDIDADTCLDELEKRAATMPGAMCGYWGVCGAAASVGAALSVIHGTGPLSTDGFYKDNMEYTSAVLSAMSRIGGARCCKRHAFLALTIGAEFANKKYGVNMQVKPFKCDFSSENAQCLKEKCPFFDKRT